MKKKKPFILINKRWRNIFDLMIFHYVISICTIELYVWLYFLYLRLSSLLVDPSNKYELSIVYKQEKYKSSISYRGWWFDGEFLWGIVIVIKKEGRKRYKPSITSHDNETSLKIFTIPFIIITVIIPPILKKITINIISYEINRICNYNTKNTWDNTPNHTNPYSIFK